MPACQPNAITSSPELQPTEGILHGSRLDDMLVRYGECCTQMKAAHILGKSVRTIFRMMEDGRLRRIGTDVDVRSIAQYLEKPRQADFSARAQKKRPPSRNRLNSFAPPSMTKMKPD